MPYREIVPNPAPHLPAPRLPVLLTGPSGRLGPILVADFESRYDLHTFDREPGGRPQAFVGDLHSLASLRAAMKGIEVVVHLAATSDEAPFLEELVPNNVIGFYNVMEAARLEGVRRVVFASSMQTIGVALKYATSPIETDENRPNSLYGVTKVMGEVMGRWYHDCHAIEFVALRLGWCESEQTAMNGDGGILNIWLSPDDLVTLFQKAIEVPGVGFAVVNGTSRAPETVLSLESAREVLGFEPRDDVRELKGVLVGGVLAEMTY